MKTKLAGQRWNNSMELSLIVPVYNVELYLRQCLESCLNAAQEYMDMFELILVDDGSTDRSGEICDQYVKTHSNVHVLHQINRGLSEARNQGIRKAAGRYIQFLDSDDWLETNNFIEYLRFLRTANSDVIVINYIEKHPKKSIIPRNHCESKGFPETTQTLLNKVLQGYLLPGMAQCYVVKKTCIESHSLKFEKGILHEDQIWVPMLLTNTDTCTIFEPILYNYRYVRKNSIMASSGFERKIQGMETVIQQLNAEYKKASNPLKQTYLQKQLGANLLLLYTMTCTAKEKQKSKEIEQLIANEPGLQLAMRNCSRLSRVCMRIPSTTIALRIYNFIRAYPSK